MLSIEPLEYPAFIFSSTTYFGDPLHLWELFLGHGYSEVHCPISDMRISSLLVLEETSYFGSLVACLEPKS